MDENQNNQPQQQVLDEYIRRSQLPEEIEEETKTIPLEENGEDDGDEPPVEKSVFLFAREL